LSLSRWLGPFGAEAFPRNVARRSVETSGPAGTARAYVYDAGGRGGTYLVLPGLHFLGPDDPRLDRFCRVLAKAGFLVVAPFVRPFLDLVVTEALFGDGRAALALATRLSEERGLGAPALFSISFGSALALDLATIERGGPRAAIVFGGFCEFLPTVRFAVTGRATMDGHAHDLPHDPLNAPVVFMNLVDFLDLRGDRRRLTDAWRLMVHRTWGRMELKVPGARDAIAHAIAAGLPSELRSPFLRGCMIEEGAEPWLDDALARAGGHLAFLDAAARLGRVKCPVALVHGRDDDVIPYFESIKLARGLGAGSAKGPFLTGLYGHTGKAEGQLGAAAREGATLVRMLFEMARAPRG
jgi:pimeloyl-ACP methyl ester carboxylesterase